ncbi:hypothetical protein [Streptomyces sp. NBC_01591]|uniref:hypothetical protein n=1 Tax=Streptomyces sp. NBC_01591 TaxID=2975888 RepID=UPI003FA34FEF
MTLELGGKSAAILLDDVDLYAFKPFVASACMPKYRPGLPGADPRPGPPIEALLAAAHRSARAGTTRPWPWTTTARPTT